MISSENINGYAITFAVRKCNNQQPAFLTISPTSFTNYHGNDWRTNYVSVETQLMVGNYMKIQNGGYFTVEFFVDLHDLLQGFLCAVPGARTFVDVDGNLELIVEWREVTQDVLFVW